MDDFALIHLFITFSTLRLEQQVQEKEELERKLYSRFVPVMNEKKAMIRGLQDELQHLQRTDKKHGNKEERQRSAWDWFESIDLNLGFIFTSVGALLRVALTHLK